MTWSMNVRLHVGCWWMISWGPSYSLCFNDWTLMLSWPLEIVNAFTLTKIYKLEELETKLDAENNRKYIVLTKLSTSIPSDVKKMNALMEI